jgi:hypothetical protein
MAEPNPHTLEDTASDVATLIERARLAVFASKSLMTQTQRLIAESEGLAAYSPADFHPFFRH